MTKLGIGRIAIMIILVLVLTGIATCAVARGDTPDAQPPSNTATITITVRGKV